MKKLSVIIGIAVAYLIVSGFNMAYATRPCPPGQEKKGWKCVDIEEPSGGSSSTSSVGDINNTNMNANSNYSQNSNTLNNANQVRQDQGQSQSSVVVNEISIKDQRKTVQTIIDFNHITPDIGKTSADFATGDKPMSVKNYGMWRYVLSLDLTEAKRMGRDTKDFKVFDSTVFENDFRTRMISQGEVGTPMGTVTFVPTGSDITVDGLFARGLEYGMGLGATHFTVMDMSTGTYHEGSKAGLDLGGSASVAAASDGSAVVAPGATMGYSKAWSSNESRPGLVFMFFFDDSLYITPVDDKGLDYSAGR